MSPPNLIAAVIVVLAIAGLAAGGLAYFVRDAGTEPAPCITDVTTHWAADMEAYFL